MDGNFKISGSALGVSIVGDMPRSGTIGVGPIQRTLTAGKAGALTTSTITLVTGHGLSTGTFDVHGSNWCRYGCTLTITGNSAVVSGGAGDSLADGAVVVCAATSLDLSFDGDNLSLILAGATRQTSVRFLHNSTIVGLPLLLIAGGAWGWGAETPTANPLTGDPVTSIQVSNGDSAYSDVFQLTGLQYDL